MNQTQTMVVLLVALVLAGCASTEGTVTKQRQAIQAMRQDVLTELYQEKPDVQAQIDAAAGYGVFSNANVNLILASFGGGYGVVTDNDTGEDTYMKMGEVGVGLGAGLKDFRVVMVFHSRETLDRFRENGLTFGAQADAAAKASEQGGAIGGEAAADNITIYQMTQTGLALQATVKGARFWPDPELN